MDVFINSLKINLKLENDFVYPLFKKRAIWLKRNYIYIHQASILLMNFLRQKCLLMKSLNYHHPLLLIIFHHLHISHKIYQKLCLSPIDKQIVIFYIYIYIYIYFIGQPEYIFDCFCAYFTLNKKQILKSYMIIFCKYKKEIWNCDIYNIRHFYQQQAYIIFNLNR